MSFIDLAPEVAERMSHAVVPCVVGAISWPGPMAVEDLRFLKRHTRRPVKMTVIGPLTTACRLANEYYIDEEALGLDLAAAINEELLALDEEGLDVIQLDEPDFHFRPDQSRRWGTRALNRALDGVRATKLVHICYGYATIGAKRVDRKLRRGDRGDFLIDSRTEISLEYEQPGHGPELLQSCGDKAVILGVLNLGTNEIESPERIVSRVREALEIVPAERLHLAPDCGMWFLPREVAFQKYPKQWSWPQKVIRQELSTLTKSHRSGCVESLERSKTFHRSTAQTLVRGAVRERCR